MAKAWISLPEHFRLEDVQAVLNIIISLLSALSVFVLGLVCWLDSAAKVARRNSIDVPSLLTIGSIGEILDVVFLLKLDFFTSTRIVAQCVVVACLTLTAILSGPIARYSTRRDEIIREKDVDGLLALAYHNSIGNAVVQWNATQVSLDRAGFPHNQLLDFLPDTSTSWVYRPEQWNSSWSVECEYTPSTAIKLHTTGDCDYLYTEIPGLDQVIANSPDIWFYAQGFYVDRTTWKDVLMFLYEPLYWDFNNETGLTHNMSITIAAVHMHQMAKSTNSSCHYGTGPIEQASYTKAQCNLLRSTVEDNTYISYPDSGDLSQVPLSYYSYYGQTFKQQSMTNNPITIISPEELVRFYQIYMITKDTQSPQPVTRTMSVQVTVVQFSAVFLAACIVATLLIFAGIVRYALFRILHAKQSRPPHTKLDWLMQTLKSQYPEGVILPGGDSSASDRFNTARYGLQEATPTMAEEPLWKKSPSLSMQAVEGGHFPRG